MKKRKLILKPEKFKFNEEKFVNLVSYLVITWLREKKPLSLSFLGNILWYIDSGAYLKFGKPLTGATYIKVPSGFMPKELMDIDIGKFATIKKEKHASTRAGTVHRNRRKRVQHHRRTKT